MASSRAYIPSRAIIKALSRPFPPPCPLSRPYLVQIIRGKRTKAVPARSRQDKLGAAQMPLSKEQKKVFEKLESKIKSAGDTDDILRPMTDEELDSTDLPVINWYEEDMDSGTPRRFIKSIVTPEDRRREQELGMMIEESYDNPEFDDTELNRRLIDNLMADPYYADLTPTLEGIKEDLTDDQGADVDADALIEEAEKDIEAQADEIGGKLRAAAHQAFQDLIDDPDLEEAREELREVQAKLPRYDDFDNPEFQAALEKSMERLKDNKAFQKRMAAMAEEANHTSHEGELDKFGKEIDEELAISEEDEEEEEGEEEEGDDEDDEDLDLDLEPSEDLQATQLLLMQVRDILKSLGSSSSLIAEIDAVLSEDPSAPQVGEFEREMDAEELVGELKQLVKADADEPKIPTELQAKVDELLSDAELSEKLLSIQRIIAEQQKTDLTAIPHETSRDPYELDVSRTTTIKEQMVLAAKSPEHLAAIQRLRVELPTPYNNSPALKSFNRAIELAYIGANDDIRRVLWRTYQKARKLPEFLEHVSDEAWDILYYSQAVRWASNQNRDSHLRALLADLKSLGRDGPPTHPSTFVDNGM